MPEIDFGTFRRSSYCADGACVEVASTPSGVLVRDSKLAESPVLGFDTEAWTSFVSDVREGRFS